ncbi:hypothetical protein L0668_10465 [Paraglaciecola aquimarina]|uniref:Uncharacterized protein n=1 Tax=Paraglaciecola algarum TaxID=3050085 RepID=A0ABS9D6K5_9ALTE|nr:hypothetical protein [Paraglaciecola sp. G1-23]MCF2948530.1 hypothetical protein [Paraglaciecola sp. G1-23]
MLTRLLSTILLFTFIAHCSKATAAYPKASIKNNSEYTISGTVHYPGCKNDKYKVGPGRTWKASSRGLCLITKITGKLSGTPASLKGTGKSSYGEKLIVTNYTSTGTSYSKFQVQAFGDRYRIFSNHEWEKVSKTGNKKSPGFRIINYTSWPVSVSLDQVGCLYYGIVPAQFNDKPGEFRRSTGAVWFTLRAHIQPDGINPQTDFDCIKPVAELVGDIGLSVLTGGAAGAGKVLVKTVVKEAVKAAAQEVIKFGAAELGRYLMDSSSITMFGQYAGYDWPFKCDQMPTYHITGGPEVLIANGQTFISPGKPFKIAKVNTCGNDMMLASVKSASYPTKLPSDYVGMKGFNPSPTPAPQPNLSLQNYRVSLDCFHNDLKNEGTNGSITASLVIGIKKVSSSTVNAPPCKNNSPLLFNLTGPSQGVKLELRTNSDNAFFIDAVSVTKNGRVKYSGKNNGRGWCLSTDRNDVNGGWKNHVSNCKSTHIFEVQ